MTVNIGARLGSVHSNGASADVWFAWVQEHAERVAGLAASMLSESEQARMRRYRNVEAASRYVITRALVRGVLGRRLDRKPKDVDVRVTDLGKPVVSDDLHFNVSHSGDLITLAVSEDRAVGIDVERRRPVQRVNALIKRWLTPIEQGEVDALRAGGLDDSDSFLRVWSAKEARLKALGVGIAGATTADLSSVVAVSLDDLLASNGHHGDAYVGAVAFA